MASSINMMPVEVIWATVDRAQADTIRDALQVQSIPCEIGVVHVQDGPAYLLWLPNADQAEAARDFIWRKQSGMRLRPDWAFAPDDGNPTFNRWIDI